MARLLVRPLHWLEPERAHRLALSSLEWLGRHPRLQRAVHGLFSYEDPRLEQELFGLHFKNPVGLAAGFDKDGRAIQGLAALGFGFLELGSVSARPSPGNPRPRVFRLPKDRAIINRMGLPSAGADRVVEQLARLWAHPVPIGLNLSFTSQLRLGRAEIIEDYLESFRKLYPYADYFAINLSCPNLPEAEFKPTSPEDLEPLLATVAQERARLGGGKPVLIKVSPDWTEAELDRVLEVAGGYIDGIIAVNTTTSRAGLSTREPELVSQAGGLSGRPLRERATEVIARIYRKTEGKLPIIGVGGIFTAADAWEKIRAGASLVQMYTGLIYEGPGIVREINRGLARLLEEHGCRSIAEAVGLQAEPR
ncbi:MAG: quinone-dependent dihydroorotate dehydrogenase [Candidatus Acetothermia bacterium]|jgi:dihydroorotate dehydrogenase|nr:quinone-dependent dihydroorotate dehydrogenase [Candidatus Acetothermia bacterium]MDH7505339.1 quinone-dependent dihydroorotate dehydrogenase [Candidatus Acetothermia bacterium]